ncbi:putative sporulation sigma-E factor-processing peptidase [Clostridia bacterium]|nr:putative sporulation sigma-E factor-processing peptidase [Clostridia bacterium]
MYIYIDVLILLNIYVNYFLISATARLTHKKITVKRLFVSALIGSFASLLVFITNAQILCLFLKLLSAGMVTYLAFGKNKLFKTSLYFLGVNFVFAGIMLLLQTLTNAVQVQNGVLYADFSILHLLIFTILAYMIICIIEHFYLKSTDFKGEYKVIIRQGTHIIMLDGLADSGNLLIEPISGRTVIVCSEQIKSIGKKYLIPFNTITESGIMEAFLPDEIIIKNLSTGTKKYVDALVSIGKTNNAIFNPKVLV